MLQLFSAAVSCSFHIPDTAAARDGCALHRSFDTVVKHRQVAGYSDTAICRISVPVDVTLAT